MGRASGLDGDQGASPRGSTALITHHQLVGAGWSVDQIKRAIRDGLLASGAPWRVPVAGRAGDSSPGAACGRAGRRPGRRRLARLRRLAVAPSSGSLRERPEISVPRGRSARLAGCRRPSPPRLRPALDPDADGVPITDPLHTMLAARREPDRARRGGGHARTRASWPGCSRSLRSSGFAPSSPNEGRNGCGVLREILDDRALGAATARRHARASPRAALRPPRRRTTGLPVPRLRPGGATSWPRSTSPTPTSAPSSRSTASRSTAPRRRSRPTSIDRTVSSLSAGRRSGSPGGT